jgi:thioredoxin-dependent peroxiredoxin
MLTGLRVVTTSATAIVQGLVRTLLDRGAHQRIALQIGDEAPDFALTGSDGRVYRVSEFRGRRPVVLAWFPKAFTGGCTAECRSIASSRAALSAFNVQYFGISVDDPETNRQFAESMDLDFPVLSDPDRSVARAYGVLQPSGFAARWTYYVDTGGRIAAIDTQVRAGTHGPDVAERLRTLHW